MLFPRNPDQYFFPATSLISRVYFLLLSKLA
jgi:hypothetical protein